MNRLMADLKINLPPHCQIKQRKGYCDVYFMPHPKDRPENWPATLSIGRTDRKSIAEITQKAEDIYRDYIAFIDKKITGHDFKIKEGSFPDIILKYKQSPYFTDLGAATKRDYEFFLNDIAKWSQRAGNPHIKLLTPKSVTKWLNTWDDKPNRQRYAKAVMSVLFGAAIREGYIDNNFIKAIKLRRRKKSEKAKLILWREEDVDRFVAECDRRGLYSLGSMVLTGIETAQRKGDVIKMRHGIDYDQGKLVYVQSKTGAKVQFNATEKLKKRLEKYPSKQMFMFIYEKTGKPWDSFYVTHMMRDISLYLGMEGYIFKHLRHSQITYLFELGLSKNIIRAITGHSENSVDQVLDNHYLEIRNENLANKGIAKINQVRQKSQTRSQTKSRTK